MRWPSLTSGILAAGLLLFAAPAHAYLDPGTGSYVFQMLAAAAVGAAFFLRTAWRRLRAARDRLRRPEPPKPPDAR